MVDPIKTADVEVLRLFAVPVMQTMLAGAAELNAELRAAIFANRKTSKGITRSNLLGWHSDLEMLRWGGEAARRLALTVMSISGARTTDIALKGDQPRYEMRVEMWANVSPAGASNQFHAHPGCLWSAVYFVDDGGSRDGALVLKDPNFPMNRMYAPDLRFADAEGVAPTLFEIAPEPGKLIMFPSWLEHGVKPHPGPGERISIAINVVALPVPPSAPRPR